MATKMHRLSPMVDTYGRFTKPAFFASQSLYLKNGKREKHPTLFRAGAYFSSLDDSQEKKFLDKFYRNIYKKLIMYEYDGFIHHNMGIWTNLKKLLFNYNFHRAKRFISPELRVDFMTQENHISVIGVAIILI